MSDDTQNLGIGTELHGHLLRRATVVMRMSSVEPDVLEAAEEYLEAMFKVGIRESEATLEGSPARGSDD